MARDRTGKDEETGRFMPGNRFWEVRSSHGRNPTFATPEALEQACSEYFTWNDENPLHEVKAFAYEGRVTTEPLPKMRAMTLIGLCMFLDVTRVTWNEWKKSRPDLSSVISWAEDIIYRQKFEGASAGQLVPNIIARDLGLADKQDNVSSDGSMSMPTVIEFVSPQVPAKDVDSADED